MRFAFLPNNLLFKFFCPNFLSTGFCRNSEVVIFFVAVITRKIQQSPKLKIPPPYIAVRERSPSTQALPASCSQNNILQILEK